MSTDVTAHYHRRPSPWAYMPRALLPSPGLRNGRRFPQLRMRWTDMRIAPAELDLLFAVTGLRAGPTLPIIAFHVYGFPLLMAMVTHPRWALPIWGALQTRNHFLQRQSLPVNGVYSIEARTGDQRILEKGAEADLVTEVRLADSVVWESVTTFYYRGQFGAAQPPSLLARSPEVGRSEVARWRGLDKGIRAFGRVSGDHNPLHYWSLSSRLSGFRRAFHHPQIPLGQALARLPPLEGDGLQRLDAWIKGPVYYGAEVHLRGTTQENMAVFGLFPQDESRPAIVGRWSAVPPGSRLVDPEGQLL